MAAKLVFRSGLSAGSEKEINTDLLKDRSRSCK